MIITERLASPEGDEDLVGKDLYQRIVTPESRRLLKTAEPQIDINTANKLTRTTRQLYGLTANGVLVELRQIDETYWQKASYYVAEGWQRRKGLQINFHMGSPEDGARNPDWFIPDADSDVPEQIHNGLGTWFQRSYPAGIPIEEFDDAITEMAGLTGEGITWDPAYSPPAQPRYGRLAIDGAGRLPRPHLRVFKGLGEGDGKPQGDLH